MHPHPADRPVGHPVETVESLRRHVALVSILEQCLLGATLLGLVALVSLPAMRGTSAWIGWTPFWLLALPAVAWCAAHLSRRHAQAALARMGRGPVRVWALVRRTRTASAMRRGLEAGRRGTGRVARAA